MFLDRLPFRKKDNFQSRYAVHFHNLTQFGGALNDNIFKYFIVFMLIALKGVGASSEILFWVGIVYVLPFLLFSSGAGVLADRLSKQRIVLVLKITEIIIIIMSFFAFAAKSEWALYTLMFLLSAQSAIFGPAKYSIIPELVEKKAISKANGLITSSTYLAIIIGTFLASSVTELTDKNFVLSTTVCLFVAIGGFITSLFIPYTKPKGTKKKINPLFIYEIIDTLRFTSLRPHLFVSVLAAAFFLFIGAFVQLNIIPFAIEGLGLDEVKGGYLFLTTAIGIAIGAVVAGRLCRKKIELGMCTLAGFGMGILFLLLDLRSSHIVDVVVILILLGLLGGLFIVPFESFIQTFSPEKKRGQIVAAANFLSFLGVALAPITIFLLSGLLKLSAPQSFFTVGIAILTFSFLITMGLGRLSFHFLFKTFLKPFFNIVQVHSPLSETSPVTLFLPHYSRLRTYLLMALSPEIEIFFFKKRRGTLDRLLYLITSYKWVYYQDDPHHSLEKLLSSDIMRAQRGAVTLLTFSKLSEKEALKMEPSIRKGHHMYRKVSLKFSFVSNFRITRFYRLIDVVITYDK